MTDRERPPAVAVLATQLDTTLGFFWARLEGLTDEEYLWEAVPDAWSVRPREQQRTSRSVGRGDWVLEFEPRDPKPAPMRTIAWLMWHLTEMCTGRADWTIGEHRVQRDDIPVTPRAEEAVANLRAAIDQWRSVFDALEPAEYDLVGRSQYPAGLDPDLPLRDILWWQNREIIHHTAEISLLRDLYLWQTR